MTPKQIQIAPEVELGELRAENAWLRNRLLIMAQALHEAQVVPVPQPVAEEVTHG